MLIFIWGGERKEKKHGIKERLLEKVIWLFIYSLLSQRDLKKALIRMAQVSSKINWHSLKRHQFSFAQVFGEPGLDAH